MPTEEEKQRLAVAVAKAESSMLASYQNDIIPRYRSLISFLIWVLMYRKEK